MTDDDKSIVYGGPSRLTSDQPTPRIRFHQWHGAAATLQQCWVITEYEKGIAQHQTEEWRDVETVHE